MNTISYQWVKTDQQLAACCSQARKQPVVALDTEFIRTRSFYAKLGVIQLYDGQQVSLIDPLTIQDFTPFVALLADRAVMKVLHACSEDLEVFQHAFQQLPTPMLDTQIMAGFVGVGISMGFAKLVQHYLGVSLDKGASRTDWLARPLSETQCQYAAADVWYLLPIYHRLAEDLTQTRWRGAVDEECEALLRKAQTPVNPDKVYKTIANAWLLSPPQLAVLQVLAKWRWEEAKKRDTALNFVVKEQSLWQLAKTQPRHTSALLSFMHPNEVRIHGKKLLWLIEQGQSVAPEQHPSPIQRVFDLPHYKPTLAQLQQTLAVVRPSDLAVELFASKRQLNQLFYWHYNGRPSDKLPELLQGWRRPFGEQLLPDLVVE